MKYFRSNLKYLREKKGLKQSDMKAIIGFSPSQWGNYETGSSKPSLDDFYKISKYFGVSEAELLNVNLERRESLADSTPDFKNKALKQYDFEKENNRLQEEEPEMLPGKKPRVVTIDIAGKENILLVAAALKPAYAKKYDDPSFIASLPAYRIPGVPMGSFRLFEVDGLSMHPLLQPGDMVFGQYMQAAEMRETEIYVLVTKKEGILLKRLASKGTQLIFKSDHNSNDPSADITIAPKDLFEVWQVSGFISRQLRTPSESKLAGIEERLMALEKIVGSTKS